VLEPDHPQLSITRQCQLLGLARATWYYQPRDESERNLRLLNLLDEQYTRTPFYGVPRMTAWLATQGERVNEKRVRRLLRLLGLTAMYPKPRLSQAVAGHRIYPYLLRNVAITRVNQVWSTDITYIRLSAGFVYLVAIMDWFSRYVLSWEVSVTLESSFCLAALDWALCRARPEIFNSDQGSQFTSTEFTGRLLAQGILISMDGRGRALDNIFVERLWRTVKYEDVYLKEYQSVTSTVRGLGAYFEFYNGTRLHQSLGYKTPAEVYRKGQ
jgi:putative transposase